MKDKPLASYALCRRFLFWLGEQPSGMSKDELENLVKKPAGGDGRGRHKIFGHIPCLDLGPDGADKIFLLISPSRHLPPAANTPEPELPVGCDILDHCGNDKAYARVAADLILR